MGQIILYYMNLCSQNFRSVEDKRNTHNNFFLENLESFYMISTYLFIFAYSDIQSTLYGCTTMYSTHKNCYDAHTTNRYILHT